MRLSGYGYDGVEFKRSAKFNSRIIGTDWAIILDNKRKQILNEKTAGWDSKY